MAALGACLLLSQRQVTFWRDPKSLWQYAVAVTNGNYYAHERLALIARFEGDVREELHHALEEVRVAPWKASVQKRVVELLCQTKRYEEAVPHLEVMLRFGEPDPAIHLLMAGVLLQLNRLAEAKQQCLEGLRLNPASPTACNTLGRVLVQQGDLAGSFAAYREALRRAPRNSQTLIELQQLSIVAQRNGQMDLVEQIQKEVAARAQTTSARDD